MLSVKKVKVRPVRYKPVRSSRGNGNNFLRKSVKDLTSAAVVTKVATSLISLI